MLAGKISAMAKKSNLILWRGDQYDTINIMRGIILEEARNPKLIKIAKEIKQRYPDNRVKQLRAVFNLGFNETRYISDPPDVQQIRRPLRLLKDARGNCVDYATFNGTFCKLLGIPAALKMVKFGGFKSFSHIYTVTRTTPPIILDQVIGQAEDGTEFLKDPGERKGYFNKEVPYFDSYYLNL